MHDPMILILERCGIQLWHVDPEKDGTDDSCGWAFPKLTKDQLAQMETMAELEARKPWFQSCMEREIRDPCAAESLLFGVFVAVARRLGLRIDVGQIGLLCSELVHDPFENLRDSLCHLPGYHSNFKEDREDQRRYTAMRLFCCVARNLMREQRPWWRHPRWHVRHWQLNIPALHALRRWWKRRGEL